MLSYLTRLELDRSLVKTPPAMHMYNKNNDTTLKEFLCNYFKEMHPYDEEVWVKIIKKLIEPSFDENRYDEMVYVFGYTSKYKHDFKKQYQFYKELEQDRRIDEETKKFIAFMAGNHFFDKYVCDIEEWFNSYYWTRPDLIGNIDYKMEYTINDILNLPYGLNYLKTILPQLNHWKR